MKPKLKFEWTFRLSNGNKELEVWLNDDVNCLIQIKGNFYKNLADKLHEITYHQYMNSVKTDINGFRFIEEAKKLHQEWIDSVEIDGYIE